LKKVLIFGASSGIGASISRHLSSSFSVYSASRNCPDHFNPDKHFVVDLSKPSVSGEIEDIIHSVNPLHVIFSSGSNIVKPIGSFTQDDISYLFNLNVISAFHIANSYSKLILTQTSSPRRSFVLISSIWSVKGAPMRSLYGLTKGGIDSLVRHLASELSPYNVYVNSIQPGFCDTPLTSKTSTDPIIQKHISRIPDSSDPFIHTSEVAEFVHYLLTSNHSFNAQSFLLDKGLVYAS